MGWVQVLTSISGKPLIYFSTIFCAFPCFSVKKQRRKKKAIPSTFFVLVKLLRKSTRKVDYQMDKNGQRELSKNGYKGTKRTKKDQKKGLKIQCSPRKMSRKA